ncbi:MAG: right-handed parallel beta-helix repeat-containing protein, partial [Candidatus Omnitrophica bacterium]|nr:right-handed parallel beta-helix repeat-containing protein [Candidatus Omnitrophota bacterium]
LYVFKEQANNPNITWATGYSTISEAVLASSFGDEIWVVEGVYNESISMSTGISLYGGFVGNEMERTERDWKYHETIIDASGLNQRVLTASPKCRIDGLTLMHGKSVLGGGVYIQSASFSISNCVIRNNHTEGTTRDAYVRGGGVYILEATVTIQDTTITENDSNMGGGVFCGGGPPVVISNSRIYSNKTTDHAVFRGTDCYSNDESGEYICMDYFETLPGKGGGIHIQNKFNDGQEFNVSVVESIIRNNVCGDEGGGMFCSGKGNLFIENCILQSNADFPHGRIARGGGLHFESQLIGPLDDLQSGLHVRINGSLLTENHSEGLGGGIYLSGSELTLEDTIIERNEAGSQGGGIFGVSAGLDIRDCTLNLNVSKREVLFGYGGACSLEECNLLIERSLLASNVADSSGGAMFLKKCPAVKIYRSWIKNNYSTDDGGIYTTASEVLCYNSLLEGNHSQRGSGAFHFTSGSDSSLTNCTLVENVSFSGIASVVSENSDVRIANCILWNRGAEIAGSQSTISHSCVQGGAEGTFNLDVYPAFVNRKRGDWSLRDGSPCIDRGENELLSEDQVQDFVGSDRVQGDQIDIGAFESPGGYAPGPVDTTFKNVFIRCDATQNGDGTSWVEALQSINDGLFLSSGGSTVWVGNGVYRESVILEGKTTVLGTPVPGINNVRLSKEISTETIVDVTGTSTSAVFAGGIVDATLMNVTLTGGFNIDGGGLLSVGTNGLHLEAVKFRDNTSDRNGGGLAAIGSTIYLERCTFSQNLSRFYGGGAYIDASTPVVVSSTFESNGPLSYEGTGSAIFLCESNNAIVNGCLIHRNETYGLICLSSQAVFSNCRIAENTGTAVLSTGMEITFQDCTIEDNHGLGISLQGGLISHCLIRGNSVGGGPAGISVLFGEPRLEDCRITGNVAINGPTAIEVRGSLVAERCVIARESLLSGPKGIESPLVKITGGTGTFTNCVMYSLYLYGQLVASRQSDAFFNHCTLYNKNSNIFMDNRSFRARNSILWSDVPISQNLAFSAENCIVRGGWQGNNIDADPQFVALYEEDFRLAPGSPG